MTTSIKFRALNDEDYKLFFEALGEHGKDFQNIQQYMVQKGGLKNNNRSIENKSLDPHEKKEFDKKEEDRKREQIRNFYNKLYAKLSELIGKLDDRVERVNQELYLLINYGEIWKRHGFKFNTKTKRLLEELVYQGSTTFRFEKKNVRLRTPPCKALKKINEIGIDEKVKVVTTREIPKEVLVEFHPASNRDWLKVQSMSQNPRVRAKLSIQKRISTILEFMESKWNLSPNKLNRTVDTWLKITPGTEQKSPQKTTTISHRLRLKPSSYHELKDVNITRVVPDNHLDLSLNAYINRLEVSNPRGCEPSSKSQSGSQGDKQQSQQDSLALNQNFEFSSLGAGTNSRLPASLTTPDCSILLERSCTSEQPSIAQARRHLTNLQILTGQGCCENSRTAYEDTQDRYLMNDNSRSIGFALQPECNSTNDREHAQSQQPPTIMFNNDIPALHSEDATLPVSSSTQNPLLSEPVSAIPTSDCQTSKSIDFQIPKNVTLGDYFKVKMSEAQNDGAKDDPIKQNVQGDEEIEPKENDKEYEEHFQEVQTKDNNSPGNNQAKLQNHMIEISKFREGWTRLDGASTTLGELYLAFKCPDKIILEYEFEQNTFEANQEGVIQENSSDNILIFKLLTAASLSLSHIERKKLEQQHKLHEQQQCSKFKKRRGSVQTMTSRTLQDIETTNQEAKVLLDGLQSTRLMFRSNKRAR